MLTLESKIILTVFIFYVRTSLYFGAKAFVIALV